MSDGARETWFYLGLVAIMAIYFIASDSSRDVIESKIDTVIEILEESK